MNPLESLLGVNPNNLNQVSSAKPLQYSKTTQTTQTPDSRTVVGILIFQIATDIAKVSLVYGRSNIKRKVDNSNKYSVILADIVVTIATLGDSAFSSVLENLISQLKPETPNPIMEIIAKLNNFYFMVNGVLRAAAAIEGFVGNFATETDILNIDAIIGAFITIPSEIFKAIADLPNSTHSLFEFAYDGLIIAYSLVELAEFAKLVKPDIFDKIANLLGKTSDQMDEFIVEAKIGVDFLILLVGSFYISELSS